MPALLKIRYVEMVGITPTSSLIRSLPVIFSDSHPPTSMPDKLPVKIFFIFLKWVNPKQIAELEIFLV